MDMLEAERRAAKRKKFEEVSPYDITDENDPSQFVGAIVASKQRTNHVVKLLYDMGWLQGTRDRITPYNDEFCTEPCLAIHLYGIGAASCNTVLDHKSERRLGVEQHNVKLSNELADLFATKDIRWVPGVRALDNRCLGFLSLCKRHEKRKFPSCDKVVTNKVTTFTFCELFAGIGGFNVGLSRIGGNCVFASELDPLACCTYIANFGGDHLYDNIIDIPACSIPDHDILTAGFPCQSFSKAGEQKGLVDEKGYLFFEVTRVLKAKQPKAFLLENVANLVFHDEGRTMATIVHQLKQKNYVVHYKILNASNIVPQQRQRVYIVGFRKDLKAAKVEFKFPELPENRPKLLDILETNVRDEYRLTDQRWNWLQQQKHFIEDPSSRIANLTGVARTLMSSYKNSYRRYTEFVKDDQVKTPRFYTPRECARLQGFPEDFVLDQGEVPKTDRNQPAIPSRIYHQLGNAVCPPVITCIGERILEVLKL